MTETLLYKITIKWRCEEDEVPTTIFCPYDIVVDIVATLPKKVIEKMDIIPMGYRTYD